MNRASQCLAFWMGVSMTVASVAVAQPSDRDRVEYAIAIHGGAGGFPVRWNGAEREARLLALRHALEIGRDQLQEGATALDVVEAVIQVLEDDARFNAGRGAVVTVDGRAELDASIMDGSNLACGAVASVTNAKNPISLARLVMSETKHVLLAGPGANQFAIAQQVPLVEPDYFLSYHRRTHNLEVAPEGPADDEPHFGTVGCVVLDRHGNLAAGTSTGGTPNKLAGRVGDSPIIGAGTYAANDSCAVSGTGIGEEYIRNSVAYDVAAQMRYSGLSLQAAVDVVMKDRLRPGTGGLISVSKSGQIVMRHNTPGMSCGAADASGRFEVSLGLEGGGFEPLVSDQERIKALLTEQVADWNAGRIEQFMNLYWRSDQLTFASGGTITRGWDATLQRYKTRYANREAMGELTFSDLEFRPLGPGAMQVMGVWKLKRQADPIDGRFTLIFRRLPAGWRIVHDHTSLRRDE
ncbi:MAG: isoaspartyl peptidase/L-asparaginase [Pirellulales bacterium]|nr:isoaspartyl peptidase/L-asparaginase [Pirellulales bacterium]